MLCCLKWSSQKQTPAQYHEQLFPSEGAKAPNVIPLNKQSRTLAAACQPPRNAWLHIDKDGELTLQEVLSPPDAT